MFSYMWVRRNNLFFPVICTVFNHVRKWEAFLLVFIVIILLKNRIQPYCDFYISWKILQGYIHIYTVIEKNNDTEEGKHQGWRTELQKNRV